MNQTRLIIGTLVVGGLIGSGITLVVQKIREPDYVLVSQRWHRDSSFDRAETGKTYTFDAGPLCVSGSAARVTAVKPREPKGELAVTGFRTVKGDSTGGPKIELVTSPCKPDGSAVEHLIVDVRAGSLPAAARGYIVEYMIDGAKKSTINPNTVRLCDTDPNLPEAPTCEEP